MFRLQPPMPSVRLLCQTSGNRLSIDSYGHEDRFSLIMRLYSDVGCWMHSRFNCVRGSINRLCWRSTNSPKWVKKSAPIIGLDTSAMVNIQRNGQNCIVQQGSPMWILSMGPKRSALFLPDYVSGLLFLIDFGADLSVLPPSFIDVLLSF